MEAPQGIRNREFSANTGVHDSYLGKCEKMRQHEIRLLKDRALREGTREMIAFLLSIEEDYTTMIKKDKDLPEHNTSCDKKYLNSTLIVRLTRPHNTK